VLYCDCSTASGDGYHSNSARSGDRWDTCVCIVGRCSGMHVYPTNTVEAGAVSDPRDWRGHWGCGKASAVFSDAWEEALSRRLSQGTTRFHTVLKLL